MEESEDLYTLDSRIIMSQAVVKTVQGIQKFGGAQYNDFVKNRLQGSTPITDTLPKNKLPLFNSPPAPTSQSKHMLQMKALKQDYSLFSRLYVACQSREGNLEEFFAHENQSQLPSLSKAGVLRSGKKSDILDCICTEASLSDSCPAVDAIILDGPAIVHMLTSGSARTFSDYVDFFISHIQVNLKKASRVDVVFDVYRSDSLKAATRAKRGRGERRKVNLNSTMPKKWKEFLCVNENKEALFELIAEGLKNTALLIDQEIHVTKGPEVLSVNSRHTLPACTHEEADTRLLLHTQDAVVHGCRRVCIRTVDSDVVVIATSLFSQISPEELWLVLGTTMKPKIIAVHELVASLQPSKVNSLLFFHAFTGCDTTSAFAGRGKKTAWEVWKTFPEVTKAFRECLNGIEELSDKVISPIERFTILMYDRTSGSCDINEARRELFTKSPVTRLLENIPPTKAPLIQHLRRATMQARIWANALVPAPEFPDPGAWGWMRNEDGWQPMWTTLPEAAKICSELIHCGCKKSCASQRCKCTREKLNCTELCACGGSCQ